MLLVAWIAEKAQILGTRCFQRGQTLNALLRVSLQRSAQRINQLRKTEALATPAWATSGWLLLGTRSIQGLEHFFRDVVLGVDVHRLLQDDVVLLGFGHLLDDFVGALKHLT